MTLGMSITQFHCPSCRSALEPVSEGPTQCPACNWRGEAYFFTPLAVNVAAAEVALPDDATCIHHPRKKANAICAGTGDYICTLCEVQINGQSYSAEYLNTAGKEKIGKAFDRYLPRPDSQVLLYLLLVFVPGVNYIIVPFAFIWIPHSFFLYRKALRLRRENPLFARVVGTGRLITIAILLTVISLAWIAGVAIILYYVSSRGRH